MRCIALMVAVTLLGGCAVTGTTGNTGVPAWTYTTSQGTARVEDESGRCVGIVGISLMNSDVATPEVKANCQRANVELICRTMGWEEKCRSHNPPVTTSYSWRKTWTGEHVVSCSSEVIFTKY